MKRIAHGVCVLVAFIIGGSGGQRLVTHPHLHKD
jgi:hypothetical protein